MRCYQMGMKTQDGVSCMIDTDKYEGAIVIIPKGVIIDLQADYTLALKEMFL
jgi:hypothetical protein